MSRLACAVFTVLLLLAPSPSPAAEKGRDHAALLRDSAWAVTGREDLASGETAAPDRHWWFRGRFVEEREGGVLRRTSAWEADGPRLILGPPAGRTYVIEAFGTDTMVLRSDDERLHLSRCEEPAAEAEATAPPAGAGTVDPWAPGDAALVLGTNVNLRAAASTKGKVVRKLRGEERLDILEAGQEDSVGRFGRHNWFRVRVAGRRSVEGWIFGAFLRAAEGCSQ